jgi:hypothetical protein
MRFVLLTAALWASAPLAAENSPPAAPKAEDKLTNYGINLDAGVPDFLALGVLWRPAYFIRVGGSATYNGAGFGARGTVTVQLFNFGITPTLTLEGGHYWAGNFLRLVQQVYPDLASNAQASALLQTVSYDYGNLHVGIEVGSTRHFMFFLRAGASYMQTTIPHSGEILNGLDPSDTSIEARDMVIRAVLPSLKLGVVAFF